MKANKWVAVLATGLVLATAAPVSAQMSYKGTSCQMSLGQQVSIVKGLYEQLLGVDATEVQISLKEADLFLLPYF